MLCRFVCNDRPKLLLEWIPRLLLKELSIADLAVWYNWNKKQHAYNLMASVLEVNEQNDLDDVYTSN